MFTADRDLIFNDFGTPATYRVVSTSTTPETSSLTRSFTDTEVTVIVGPIDTKPATGTSHHATTNHIKIYIASDQLPPHAPRIDDQLLIDNISYTVTHAQVSNYLTILTCRR